MEKVGLPTGMLDLDDDELRQEALLDLGPTPRQRQALYKMGRSRAWVKKYVRTRQQASRLIDNNIREFSFLTPSKDETRILDRM